MCVIAMICLYYCVSLQKYSTSALIGLRTGAALTACGGIGRGQQGPQHVQWPRTAKTMAAKRARAPAPPRTPPAMAPMFVFEETELPGSVQRYVLAELPHAAVVVAVS